MKNWLGTGSIGTITAAVMPRVLLMLLMPQLAATAANNHAQLQLTVESYLLDMHAFDGSPDQRIEVTVGYIDPRLNVPDCSEALKLSLNGNRQGKVNVRVQCLGSAPWAKFVPAEVNLYSEVLVASENSPRGTILESHHFQIREIDISRLRRSPLLEADHAIGMELKRSLTSGSPLTVEAMQRPKVIRRGDAVQLVVETRTLRVRQQGEALQDGEVGKLINVRNNSSKMIVQAVVVAAGKVKVQL